MLRRLSWRTMNGAIVAIYVAIGLASPAVVALQTAGEVEEAAPNAASAESSQGILPQNDVAASQNQVAAPAVEQAFVGTNQCFVCHRPQTNMWSETKHAQAFTNVPERYRSDATCLKCHVTGFGKANGFVAGTEKDLFMVGCESCHGPGAKHVDAANRFVLATPDEEAQIQKEMKQTIIRTPTDTVCAACHITQAHGTHPEYGESLPEPRIASSAVARGSSDQCNVSPLGTRAFGSTSAPTRYSPGYSVKTCGSCHYDQYLRARAEKHFSLSSMLPSKYMDDQNCQKCHVKGEAAASRVANTATHVNHIGVSCESCHGPALDHVQFNVRFIHGPPLRAELDQAARDSIRKTKPDSSCIECHVGESHKEHPEFEADSPDGSQIRKLSRR